MGQRQSEEDHCQFVEREVEKEALHRAAGVGEGPSAALLAPRAAPPRAAPRFGGIAGKLGREV